MTKPYVIDTDHPTKGPWRVTGGNRYASVTMADGRKLHISVVRGQRARHFSGMGWRWHGYVRDTDGKLLLKGVHVTGSVGVRGVLKLAGLLP